MGKYGIPAKHHEAIALIYSKVKLILMNVLIHSVPITVCPGSSDPPEKIFNIFAPENEVDTIY